MWIGLVSQKKKATAPSGVHKKNLSWKDGLQKAKCKKTWDKNAEVRSYYNISKRSLEEIIDHYSFLSFQSK